MTSIRLMMEKRLLKEFTDIARKTNNAELLTVIREEQAMLQAARSATSQDIARLERLKKELGVDGVNFAEAPPIDPYVV